jgi:uncharacterized membrane protein YcjF (UPF0283 family)
MPYLIIIAIIILIILTSIAGYYLWQVHQLKKRQTEQNQKNQQAWKAHQEELAKDVRFIANSMVQGQCELTEGCMRLQYLMDKLDEGLKNKPEFRMIHLHYEQTQHMPTHDAYKALDRKSQFKLDNERFKLEDSNRDGVLKEASLLLNYRFERIHPN